MDIEVLFKKINKVFKYGVYLIDYSYCIGDKKSMEKINPDCIITLNPAIVKEIKEKFKDKKIIHFSVLKKTEEEILEGIEEMNENDIVAARSFLKNNLALIENKSPWKSVNLPSDLLNAIYDEGDIRMYKFEGTDTDFPLGKKSFPSIEKENVNDCIYKLFPLGKFDVKCCDFRYSDSDYSLDMIYTFL